MAATITLTGKIKKIFDAETFGKFEKRVFWLEEIAEDYPNTFALELWKDHIKLIDAYSEGDTISCSVDLKGKCFPKAFGDFGVINTFKCWKIANE